MTDSTLEMLTANVESVAETIAEYARQISSGEFKSRTEVINLSQTVGDAEFFEALRSWMVRADVIDGDDLDENYPELSDLEQALEDDGYELDDDTVYRVREFDVPTIVDEYGNEESIDDWPLAVVVKIGQPLAVQLTVGGPHIEIVQDLSNGSAKLAGYWGGEKVFRHGDQFQTVLDYFTDALWDEAPEEYK